ncbi:MAG: hypothetical protein JXR48_00820 [Candidatus Delongbacteria bacterium]|nr:hypothetical protein [Candidatus Delongbacteria bacterium]MBN2833485.1 hypothetical protein [Candidatus Delongbacteria bacterium]
MKKLVALVLFVAVAGVMASGLRCSALGGMSSLIDSKNISTFPQRTIMHGETAWFGSVPNSSSAIYGGVRYHMFDNMALQINASRSNSKSMPFMNNLNDNFETSAFNVFDLSYSYKLDQNMIAGLALKYYYNDNSYLNEEKESFSDPNINTSSSSKDEFEHSIWYFTMNPGFTMKLDDKSFVDGVINFGFGSFSGESTTKTTQVNTSTLTDESISIDNYKVGVAESDSWFNFGFEARYSNSAIFDNVDIVPYLSLNYTDFGTTTPDTLEVDNSVTEYSSSVSDDYEVSTLNFTLGSGVHWKVKENIKIYNELEFRYYNECNTNDLSEKASAIIDLINETYSHSYSKETNSSTTSLFPIYRFGLESTTKFEEDSWVSKYTFIDKMDLRFGFIKKFDSIFSSEEISDKTNTNDSNDNSVTDNSSSNVEESSISNDFTVTGGIALYSGNWTIELLGVSNEFVKGLNFDEEEDDDFLSHIDIAKFQLTYKF